MKIKATKVNAFTKSKNGGNPAGVVLDAPNLTYKQMCFVSKKLNVSETAFVFPSKKADYKVRFFSPETEVDLCGHATIAAFYTIAEKVLHMRDGKMIVTQDTKVGVLPVNIYFKNGKVETVMMGQSKPILKDIHLDIFEIADSLNITTNEIKKDFPIQIVSTGLFTLPVCIKSMDILKKMKPDFTKIKEISKKINTGSFHVFTFDTIEEDSVYHARNFASLYGIDEDPVTGTANGATCNYLLKNNLIRKKNLKCEQGDIVGKPGRIFVNIENDTTQVGGKAVIVKEEEIEIP